MNKLSIKLKYDLVPEELNNYTACYLVDMQVNGYNNLMKSSNKTTLAIGYHSSSSKTELMGLLNKLPNLTRIAFLFDNRNINNKLFLDDKPFFTKIDIANPTPSGFSENVVFIKNLPNRINKLDFLCCKSLTFPDWVKYYALLPQRIGASNDLTGNTFAGGDWTMENTQEDIQNVYFGEEIKNYQDTLWYAFKQPARIIKHSTTLHQSDIPVFDPNNFFAFLIQGDKPITVKLASDFVNITAGVYFVIGSPNVTIIGSKSELVINAGINYWEGLVRNGDGEYYRSYDNSTVRNINISANFTGILQNDTGFICGGNYGINSINHRVEYCVNNAIINGGNGKGGIIGASCENILIKCCINNGAILDGNNCGGISGGSTRNAIMLSNKNTGNISGNTSNCGGIVGGYNTKLIVKSCKNSGLLNIVGAPAYIQNDEIGCNGGIAGGNSINTTIELCKNYGTLTLSGTTNTITVPINATYVTAVICNGGIVGGSNSNITIKCCKNKGSIIYNGNATYVQYSGGIAGGLNNTINISKCINTGNINGYTSHGICSTSDNVIITDCENYGDINNGVYCGGITYCVSNSTITNCRNYGNISGYYCVGIVLGRDIIITNCRNYGNITSGYCAGISINGGNNIIKKCSNSGSLYLNSYGISGNNTTLTKIYNCYVSSLAIQGQNPVYDPTPVPNTEGITVYKSSGLKEATGKWRKKYACKYLGEECENN